MYWLGFVLTSGCFALTESAFLFLRASESSLASKGEIADFVGAPQFFSAERFNEERLHFVEGTSKHPAL